MHRFSGYALLFSFTFTLLFLFAALVLLPGCQGTRTSDRDLTLVTPSEGVEAVEGTRRAFGQRGQGGVWVDARSESEFNQGHIPGAINLPIERARQDHEILRDYRTIIVYGNDFNSARANALSKVLIELRHRDVRTLHGGLRAWKDAGHSVASDQQ